MQHILLTGIVLFAVMIGMQEQMIFADHMPNLIWVWLMLASGALFKSAHASREQNSSLL